VLLVREKKVVRTERNTVTYTRSVDKEGRVSTATRVKEYYSLVEELLLYVKERQSYWLAPLIFVLLLLSALAFFLEGSVLAPAIYSVF
jgi:hypothetical protein